VKERRRDPAQVTGAQVVMLAGAVAALMGLG
jgi:hypothetical protein